jgi:L-ribulose-5-phosphate 4-epimerase
LYKRCTDIGGVVHTHSEYATAWAQARREIPCFGTTHADYFHGAVPVTEPLDDKEISSDYEKNTGEAVVRLFGGQSSPSAPGALVANHGPFTWGTDVTEAVHNAVILESIARMAFVTMTINAEASAIDRPLHDCHYFRKHGKNAYYGQTNTRK